MWEHIPVKQGELVRDEMGVYGRVGKPVSVWHAEGKVFYWSVQVEYARNGRWWGEFRVLGPAELSVWRDGEWISLSRHGAESRDKESVSIYLPSEVDTLFADRTDGAQER